MDYTFCFTQSVGYERFGTHKMFYIFLDSAKALISLYCIRKKGNVPQFSETYANMQHIRQKKSLYNSYEC